MGYEWYPSLVTIQVLQLLYRMLHCIWLPSWKKSTRGWLALLCGIYYFLCPKWTIYLRIWLQSIGSKCGKMTFVAPILVVVNFDVRKRQIEGLHGWNRFYFCITLIKSLSKLVLTGSVYFLRRLLTPSPSLAELLPEATNPRELGSRTKASSLDQ